MKNPFAIIYNFRGNLSRRDFAVYWLWVYLLPKIWPFIGGLIYWLVCGTDFQLLEMAGGVLLTTSVHLLLMSFFVGAMWRRLNDIGYSVWPKLIICSLSFFIPPYGWMLQLYMLLRPSRRKD